jgi:putative transposase
MAHVECNPVHAGMVASAEEYRWSSARAHLGCEDETGFVDLTAWLARYNSSKWREVLRNGVDEAVFRDRLREASRRGRALGSVSFVEQLERQTGRRLRPKPPGRPKKDGSAAAQMSLEIGV